MRLVEPAFDDLVALNRKDPQIVRWALKKLLLLERDPEAGEELKGPLIGWRKIVVSDRDWRIVWRVTHDVVSDNLVVDVAEVWAVGARADAEVYSEMAARIDVLGNSPDVLHLAAVIERLGKTASGVDAKPEPQPKEPIPTWLQERLVHTAGISRGIVDAMSHEQAVDAWAAWVSRPNQ